MTELSVFLNQHAALKVLQRDDTLYLAPNIPTHKLNNALNAYADTSVSPEQVILLIDDTVFGSAKDGLLLTATDLYIKEGFGKSRTIALNKISNIALKPEFLTNLIHINDQPFVQLAQPNKSTLKALCEILSDYIAQHAGQAAHSTTPAKDKETATASRTNTPPNNHSQQQPTKNYQQPHHEPIQPQTNSKPAHDAEFEVGLICADILTHYAFMDEVHWTPQNLSSVTQFCEKFIESLQQKTILKQRLQQTQRPSLPDLVRQLNRYGLSEELRVFLVMQVYELLYRQNYDLETLEQQAGGLAKVIALDSSTIREVLDELRSIGFTETDHDSESSYQQISSPIEQACQILAIEPRQLNLTIVQQAYRSKVAEFHPDKYHNLPEAVKTLLAEKTRELNQARQVLLDYLN